MRLPSTQRRVTIEEAAAELFAEQGYAATTIAAIVARAGVTKPMLYRHFEGKQELALVLLERHRDALAAAPLDALLATADRPLPERINVMLEAWFAYVVREPFVRLLLHDASGDEQVAALVEELHGRQRAADVALVREFAPHIPEDELEPIGEIIRSSLSGLGLWLLDHPDYDRARLIAAMRRMVLGLTGAASPGASASER